MTTYSELAALQQAATDADARSRAAAERYAQLLTRRTPVRERRLAESAATAAAADATAAGAALAAALAASTAQADPLVPALLLPVRIETRYGATAQGAVELRIRVYPDDIHFDSHRTALTEREGAAGAAYWSAVGSATTPDESRAAWGTLAREVGPARVEWVASATDPAGPGATVSGTDAWTQAEQAALLPDAWFVTAWRGDRILATATGKVIARPLHVGPDPASATADDPGIAWMSDYAQALRVGMAVTMELPDDGPIDLLTVAGIRGTDPATVAADELGDLLTAHRFTVGFDLVPPGSPTNTTQAGPSPIGSVDPGGLDLYTDPTGTPTPDGPSVVALREALGLPAVPPLAHGSLASADVERDLATALWPGTWGYYLSQMLRLHDFDAQQETWRQWTLDNVRGSGPLPAVRVGRQPYGILPILPLEQWRPTGSSTALVVAELGPAPRRRGLARATTIRALDQVGDDGGWTVPVPLGAGPDAPADATGVTVACGTLPDGAIAAFAFPGTVFRAAAEISCPIGHLTRDGWRPAGELKLPLGQLLRAEQQLLGIGLAFASLPDSAARGRTDAGDLVVLLQCEPTAGGARTATLLVAQGVRADGTVEAWSDPVDVSAQFSGADLVQSIAVTVVRDTAWLLVTSGPAHATAAGTRLTLHQVRGLGADGTVAGRWAKKAEIGPAFDPSVTPAGGALVPLPGDTHVAAVSFFGTGSGLSGSYSVHELDDRSGVQEPPMSGPFNLGSYPSTTAAASCTSVTWRLSRGLQRGLGDRTQTANLLQHLKDVWLRGASSPVRAGVGDPTRQLLDILASDATAQHYASRPLLGEAVIRTVARVLDPADTPGPALDSSALNDLLTTELGLLPRDLEATSPATWWSRLLHGRFSTTTHDTVDLIGPDVDAVSAAAIDALVTATPQQLHDHVDDAKTPLLERLLRYSLLQAYVQSAFLLKPPQVDDTLPPLREPEFVDLPDFSTGDPSIARTVTSWRYLSEETLNGHPLAEIIVKETLVPSPAAWAQPVVDVLAALRRLRDVPTADLGLLAANVLDVAAYRLDAWITGFATSLLSERRSVRPAGVVIGAFGMVTDLAPARGASPTTGYVYAPSLTHATTAAVLRAGYLSHGDGQLTIDLSSRRVRGALDIMDAVSQGQSLGAVLGQRLERGLHAARLDVHLTALRQAAPLQVGLLTPVPAGASAADVAGAVRVDGLQLLGLRNSADGSLPWGTHGLPTPSAADASVIEALVAQLADDIDAIGDIGVAEGVHQVLQRNTQRGAAALDAVSRGDAPLPTDPDVQHVPVPGVGVTHRIVLHAPAASSPVAGWGRGLRSDAEPRLDHAAALMLPDPRTTYWRATYLDADGAEVGSDDFTLADLGLCALDVLALTRPGAGDLATTPLGRLAALHAQGLPRPAGSSVRIDVGADPTRSTGLGIADFLTVAGALRSLVLSARPARSADLAPAGMPAEDGVDLGPTVTDLRRRLTQAVDAFADATSDLRKPFATTQALRDHVASGPQGIADLVNLLDLPADADLQWALDLDTDGTIDDQERPRSSAFGAVRSCLADLTRAGIDGIAPGPVVESVTDERLALTRLAAAAARTAAERHGLAADAVARADAATSPDEAIDALLEGFGSLLGEGTVILPVLATALPGSAPAGFDELTAWDWAEDVADVREATGRLRDAAFLAEASGGGRARWTVRQHSSDPGDGWAATQTPAGRTVPRAATSISLVGAEERWPTTELAGLLVDSWVEVVPTGTADTAVTFHLDTPDARAPQAALLAVHPDPSRPWDTALLSAVVREAFQLATVRSVDPDDVPLAGQLLPAILLTANPSGDAVRVDLEA